MGFRSNRNCLQNGAREMAVALSGKNSKPLTLAQAARLLPNRPNPVTLWRWRTKGIRGVRLRTELIGGRRFTRREWLDDFRKAVNAAASGEADGALANPETETKRPRSAETSRRLKRAGLIR
jgi:Protein of unknown function (DUF1580)